MRALLIAAALSALAATASAQEAPAPGCATTDASLPAEWAGWAKPTPLTAATADANLSKAALKPGQAVNADLAPTPSVKFVLQPEKPGGSVSKAGMFELQVDQAGRYAIALSSGAWLDVISGKTAAVSVAHGHGPACTSLRKIVEFDLKPGRYVVQVSANADPQIKMMVARKS